MFILNKLLHPYEEGWSNIRSSWGTRDIRLKLLELRMGGRVTWPLPLERDWLGEEGRCPWIGLPRLTGFYLRMVNRCTLRKDFIQVPLKVRPNWLEHPSPHTRTPSSLYSLTSSWPFLCLPFDCLPHLSLTSWSPNTHKIKLSLPKCPSPTTRFCKDWGGTSFLFPLF